MQVIGGLFLAPPLLEVVAAVAVFEVPVHTDPSSSTAEDSEFCKDISTEFPEPEGICARVERPQSPDAYGCRRSTRATSRMKPR